MPTARRNSTSPMRSRSCGRLGLRASVIETGEDEVRGINTKAQLAQAEHVMQARLREAALTAGVTMVSPETVYLAADTTFGKDVMIEPFVVIGPGVSIGDGAVIHAFSHLVQASVGAKASVGPYARLRPGTSLGEGSRVGNFVEIKAATLDAGAKVNHLYLHRRCPYRREGEYRRRALLPAITMASTNSRPPSVRGAFVGSNSSLVAPVAIGAGAYVGSGSVITEDVPDNALAVARGRQAEKPDWASHFRKAKAAAKEAKDAARSIG